MILQAPGQQRYTILVAEGDPRAREALRTTLGDDGHVVIVASTGGQALDMAPGSDADLVVWDPSASKTITTAKSVSKVGYNVFEGRTVTGLPAVTLSQGKVVWTGGDLRAVRGAGRFVKRPPFPTLFDAMRRQAALHAPQAVNRSA